MSQNKVGASERRKGRLLQGEFARVPPYLWHGNLKRVVAHTEGRRVDSGDDNHSGVWMGQRSRVRGKVQGDVDPSVIEQRQRLQVTWTKRSHRRVTNRPPRSKKTAAASVARNVLDLMVSTGT